MRSLFKQSSHKSIRFAPLCLFLCGLAAAGTPHAAMGAENTSRSRQTPAPTSFKTERESKPGDWGRYEHITESQSFGQFKRLWIFTETLANDGMKVTSRATLSDPEKSENITQEYTGTIGGTIEGTLFSDVKLTGNERIRKGAPVRQTLVVAGHSFDCIVLSATASAGGVQTEAKVWYSPEAPFLGMVKKETVSKAMRGRKEWLSVTYRTELTEWGDASHPPAR